MINSNKKPMFSFSWIYMMIGGVLLYMYFFGEKENDQVIGKPYTVVEDYIKCGYVEDITVINKDKMHTSSTTLFIE